MPYVTITLFGSREVWLRIPGNGGGYSSGNGDRQGQWQWPLIAMRPGDTGARDATATATATATGAGAGAGIKGLLQRHVHTNERGKQRGQDRQEEDQEEVWFSESLWELEGSALQSVDGRLTIGRSFAHTLQAMLRGSDRGGDGDDSDDGGSDRKYGVGVGVGSGTPTEDVGGRVTTRRTLCFMRAPRLVGHLQKQTRVGTGHQNAHAKTSSSSSSSSNSTSTTCSGGDGQSSQGKHSISDGDDGSGASSGNVGTRSAWKRMFHLGRGTWHGSYRFHCYCYPPPFAKSLIANFQLA